MTTALSPQTLQRLLGDGRELALLDVRPQGAFSRGHLFHAVNLPADWLELQLHDLLPRRGVRVVLCDAGGGDDLAQRVQSRLVALGYRDVRYLAGGVAAWEAAGLEVFRGVNVPSKAFGEFIEHAEATPHIEAHELQARLQAGEKMLILDSRPREEFQRMSIPGGLDCPGAELVHRVFELLPDAETPVVVNCAGRTRSIIGAQSLRNAGLTNPVMALKDGTMGWKLAGFALSKGEHREAPLPSPRALAQAQAAAQRVAARFGVRRIDRETLSRWQADPQRTLYLLDVRSPEEYQAGHLPGSRPAPGGQLVQATDEYVAVRNSRLVLVDDHQVRATMTASWLLQMGWSEVYVLATNVSEAADRVTGPHRPQVPGLAPVAEISPQALHDLEQPVVVDLDTSLRYREGHIPGARWATRGTLVRELPHLGRSPVLTSREGILAHLAARELLAACPGVRVLAGGTQAWIAACLPLEQGLDAALTPDDVWYKPYDQQGGVEQAMRAYLNWEVALLAQLEREAHVGFRRY